jgi:hypothetical protein
MRWLESQLREWNKLDVRARGEHPCVYPVWFDPWKFQTREDVWRGIIAEVILALFRIETVNRENFVPQMIEAAKKFGSFLGKGSLHALANMDVKIRAPAAGGDAGALPPRQESDREILSEAMANIDFNVSTSHALLWIAFVERAQVLTTNSSASRPRSTFGFL